jgi:hypothetical protein
MTGERLDDTYGKSKFYEAVALLIGPAPLQKRLSFAISPLVTLRASGHTVQHLSPELELRFQKLMDQLTAKPRPDSNDPYASFEISDDEARALADEILSIFVEVMGGL